MSRRVETQLYVPKHRRPNGERDVEEPKSPSKSNVHSTKSPISKNNSSTSVPTVSISLDGMKAPSPQRENVMENHHSTKEDNSSHSKTPCQQNQAHLSKSDAEEDTWESKANDDNDWETQWDEGRIEENLSSLSIENKSPSTSNNTKIKPRVVKGRGTLKYANHFNNGLASDGVDDDDYYEDNYNNNSRSPSLRDRNNNNQSSNSYNASPNDKSANTSHSNNNDSPMDHIVEIYDFPEHYDTDNLKQILEPYVELGYRIKWVDNAHALIIFRSAAFANDALKSIKHPDIKVRPYNKASEQSKSAFNHRVSPSHSNHTNNNNNSESSNTPRPKTTASVARRLIGNALQMQDLLRAQDQRDGRNNDIDQRMRRSPKAKSTATNTNASSTTTTATTEERVDYFENP